MQMMAEVYGRGWELDSYLYIITTHAALQEPQSRRAPIVLGDHLKWLFSKHPPGRGSADS